MQEVIRMKPEELASLACLYQGNWNRIHTHLITQRKIEIIPVEEPYITCLDALYPACLKELECPPYVLFCRGNPSLLKKRMITIVGSRELTLEGACITEEITAVLAEKYVIISGMARGADGISHRTALAHGGHTIGVCGHGLDTVYPKENRDLYQQMEKTDLILSEYPVHTPIARCHFPWRNRILAALGEALIVTQAKVKSGTMHTVAEALKLGRDIYCVPYPYGSKEGSGCNLLIQEGADMLYDTERVKDLL